MRDAHERINHVTRSHRSILSLRLSRRHRLQLSLHFYPAEQDRI